MQNSAAEVTDPVELMLQKTGCINLHYKVQVVTSSIPPDSFIISNIHLLHTIHRPYLQECIAETQDWRKCQDIVKEFKSCMQLYTDQQRAKYQKQ